MVKVETDFDLECESLKLLLVNILQDHSKQIEQLPVSMRVSNSTDGLVRWRDQNVVSYILLHVHFVTLCSFYR